MKKTILAISTICSAAVFAAVPIQWTVETSRVQPAQFDAYHGEEIAFEATLQSYGKPLAIPSDADLRMFWQTNGMGNVYWSTNATLVSSNVISAVFRPAYDPGSASVAGFLGIPASNYRAAFTIRFRGSPGATPFNPPPIEAAEYYTKSEIDAATNALFSAATDYTDTATNGLLRTESDPTVADWAKSGQPQPQTSLAPATNYTDKVAATKQDSLPYATNAIPAGVIANAPWLESFTESDPTVADWAKSGQPQPQTSLAPATNYTDKVAATKQDSLPYATNAIPAGVIANAPWLESFTESDPNVPAWAKAAAKPSYTADEVGALATTGGVMSGSITLRRADTPLLVSDVSISTNGVAGWHYTGLDGATGIWESFSFNWWDLLTSSELPDNAAVLTNGYLKTKSGTSITAANISGAVPWREDRYGNMTAITIGSRNGDSTLVGGKSFTQGESLIARGNYSHAEGVNTSVYGDYSHAEGRSVSVKAADSYSWTWNGKNQSYTSHGSGTFSVNPDGGTSGFYIGSTNLDYHVSTAIASAGHLTQAAADAAYYPKSQGDAWSTYWDGDDVRVTVTNYDSSVNLPSLYLEQKTNTTALATNLFKTVWTEMTHWDKFLGTNWNWRASWNGFKTWADNITDSIAEKADRAWGFYNSATGLYSPDNYTVISSSNVMIAAGMSYQKTVTTEAEVWILTANEPYEPTGVSTNGGFQIKDSDGNVQFEIVKGDKVTVAAQANAVGVTNGTLYVVYNIVAAQHPTAEVCLDLSAANWKAETAADCPATVTWTGSSGAYVAGITPNQTTTNCFVKATYQQGGDTYINNRCAVGMSQIILNGTTYNLGTATISGNTVLTLTPAN